MFSGKKHKKCPFKKFFWAFNIQNLDQRYVKLPTELGGRKRKTLPYQIDPGVPNNRWRFGYSYHLSWQSSSRKKDKKRQNEHVQFKAVVVAFVVVLYLLLFYLLHCFFYFLVYFLLYFLLAGNNFQKLTAFKSLDLIFPSYL